jgi:hypothetical protein
MPGSYQFEVGGDISSLGTQKPTTIRSRTLLCGVRLHFEADFASHAAIFDTFAIWS